MLFSMILEMPITGEEYWIARMIEGEGYNLVSGTDAAWYLADTVYNRIDAGWCSGVSECILGGYWGHTRAPVPHYKSILLAKEIVANKGERTRPDIFFAFSHGDVEYLGLKASDAVVSVTVQDYGFYFYGRGALDELPEELPDEGGATESN